MEYLFWGCAVVMLIVAALGAWRFFTLRATGTPVAIRRLPAQGVHGWRHGIVRYEPGHIRFYKLRSLSPMSDAVFVRHLLDYRGTRTATSGEESFLPYREKIIVFHHDGTDYEAQFPSRGGLAFSAWIESAPDVRMDRLHRQRLLKKMRRNGKNALGFSIG